MSNEPIATKTIWNANFNDACGVLAFLYGGAIRIKGEAGGLKHCRSDKIYHFTSITELSIYESIPGL